MIGICSIGTVGGMGSLNVDWFGYDVASGAIVAHIRLTDGVPFAVPLRLIVHHPTTHLTSLCPHQLRGGESTA